MVGTTVSFIMSSLNLKLGAVQHIRERLDLSILGTVFKNMPVYEQGRQSLENMQKLYIASNPQQHLGRDNFVQKAKLIIKQSEAKASLFSY